MFYAFSSSSLLSKLKSINRMENLFVALENMEEIQVNFISMTILKPSYLKASDVSRYET